MKATVLDMGTKQNRRTLDRMGGVSSVIGAGSRFSGDFGGKENYVVYGHITGNADVEGAVVLEEGASWKGVIKAEYVIIAGTVDGDVIATGKIELDESARVSGNVIGSVIAIAEGAVIEGQMKMTSDKAEITRFIEQRRQSRTSPAG